MLLFLFMSTGVIRIGESYFYNITAKQIYGFIYKQKLTKSEKPQ